MSQSRSLSHVFHSAADHAREVLSSFLQNQEGSEKEFGFKKVLTRMHGAVGLDAVIVLELDDEALAVKRAVGRRVDPLTGRVYHIEFDAPPANEPGLAARLKVCLQPACTPIPCTMLTLVQLP